MSRLSQPNLLFLLLPALLASGGGAMFFYPDPQASLLEHLLVDHGGARATNFSAAISPCTNYVTEVGEPSRNSGRTTAAQWLRVAFHDFVTADTTTAAGTITGGIDASIGFETARAENKGMSDLIALGTVMSVHLCGGKAIPYRPGRIDALHADPTTGVPEPETGVDETLEEFGRAGFNRQDAIALTACGHTLGSVHHGGFPEVVGPEAVTPTNTNGGSNFDSTRGAFDPLVVHEYIDSTGSRGGALVTSFNETARSDLRLYESDGNQTMRGLYDMTTEAFQDTCAELLGRMIDTVPSGVRLRDAIAPMAIKPVNVTWDFNGETDRLVLSGNIRILWGAPTVTKVVTFSSGDLVTSLSPEPEKRYTAYGMSDTYFYPFSIPGSAIGDATSFTVSGDNLTTQTFPISRAGQTFFVPSMSTATGTSASFTVASSTDSGLGEERLAVQVAAPVAQPLTLAPKIVTATVNLIKAEDTKSGFQFWKGSYDVYQQVTGAISLTLTQGGETLDHLLLGAGVAGW
ncbi:heme peroxidase [Apiospora hydei]|uniref:Peroxidase n=1 Tax=Apiospora hydei TaxID=1337664 RepID=A0ABR1WZD6_9PEZI